MQNFTATDLVQTTLATLAFALFLVPPGYLLGLASNPFGMRRRSATEKVLFSVMFSFAATPILAVLLTRISSYKVTLAVFLLLALISVGTLVRQTLPLPGSLWKIRRSTWLVLGMMLGWFVLVQLSLADLQIGHRLYVSFLTYDHSLRVSMVEAAARGGVPPHNPFYGLGKIPVLRYFYYWYVVCALPMQLFGLGARACFNASVFWSGLGLASIVPLFLKHFFGETEQLRGKSVIGIALLCVTGLDLLPYAAMVHRFHLLIPDIEWWDTNQITSWLGSLLWVPHHVASLTASMAGLLVLSMIEEQTPLREIAWAVAIAALAFASAAGLSVYVVFSFAIFMVLWTLVTLAQRRFRTFAAYLASGAFALLLSWPYLHDLLSKQSAAVAGGAAAGDRFAYFAVRDYLPGLEFLGNLGVHSPWLIALTKLPMLAYVYLLEFGFFALIVPLYWRRERHAPGQFGRQRRMAWAMFAICLLTLSFVKSDTSGTNDLGWRGVLVVQFVLLLWAAPVLYELFRGCEAAAPSSWVSRRWVKITLVCALTLGVAGSAVQLALLRAYAPLADSGRLARSETFLGAPGFGERTYWMRDGFSRLSGLTPSNTSVQYNPVQEQVLIAHLYSARQTVMGDDSCGSAFGGNTAKCKNALPYFATVFNRPDAVRNWNVDQFCDDFAVHVLVATNADPVWNDPDSWVWTRPSLVANPMMRAVACGVEPGALAGAR